MIIIGNSGCEKSLGVKLDWQLNFYAQISDICKIACRKLNALIRIPPFIGLSKRHILMKAFFNSQFSYCTLIWMCHSRTNNRKINRLLERCSCFIYNDKQLWFSELLVMNGLFYSHEEYSISGY